MEILKKYDLLNLNTFGVSAFAKFFVEVKSEKDLKELFNLPEFNNNKKMFLGSGSNILFTQDFDGIVVLNKLKGIEILEENSEIVAIRAMGGEFWHDLVNLAVSRGYWGIENLAFIPGTASAAPMQNIGAYGAELKDTLLNVEVFEIETGIKKIFSKEECVLGYRESIFKNKLKDKYFISAMTLELSKTPRPNLSYKILADYLEKLARRGGNKIEIKNPKDISDAVTSIRKSKLPDPKILGNAGSFFKNVFIDKKRLDDLLKVFPEMPYFTEKNGSKASVLVKVPAGWMIEQCGPALPRRDGAGGTSWKGYRIGNVGVHEKHALILVNYGGATGKEIMELANKIIASVKEKFSVELALEVNLL